MIKKPMLLRKLKENNGSERKIIGLLGAHRGAGVTYTGVLIAYFFAVEKGIKTAYLECNNHRDFIRLQNSYEWDDEDDNSFSLDQITYYKQVHKSQIAGILNENYESYIIDFGTDFISAKEDFMRCTSKIIIGDRSVWNLSKTVSFLKNLELIKGSNNWIHMIPCADQRAIVRMRNISGKYFCAVPYEEDPTSLSKRTSKMFHSLFY
ncbi:MAG: hypothetical protein GX321_02420 [Clostridiales bacterium]|nr:hypothetical protein [Clostridiales bacterium]